MSTLTIVIILAVVALIALAAAGGGGPRITQITRRRTREKDGDDA